MRLRTYTGVNVDPFNVKPEQVNIEDIAHSLSNLCRFGGHTRTFYSVAQHSIRVCQAVPNEHKLVALMHDATEAYVVDLPAPIKVHMPDYKRMEQDVWRAICQRFNLPLQLPDCVHEADNKALLVESKELLDKPFDGYTTTIHEAIPYEAAFSPLHAEMAFKSIFAFLWGLKK